MATESGNDRVMVADLEVSAVKPDRTSLVMDARGVDGSDYMLEMHFEMPIDRRTQTVLGELLAQSELRVWRTVRQSLRSRARRVGDPVAGA